MVDLSSARLDNGRETVLELDGDHSGICKFSGPDDHAYSSVGPGIESMVDRAEKHRAGCEHNQSNASTLTVEPSVTSVR